MDYVRVLPQLFHDLQFSVLITSVLKHLLNGNRLASLCDCRLVDGTKRSVVNDTRSVVGEIPSLPFALLRNVAARGITCTTATCTICTDVMHSGYMMSGLWTRFRLS
jgi:hypothetical protein